MKKLIFLSGILLWLLYACNSNQSSQGTAHEHEPVKLQLIAYNDDFELYAEADPFVLGRESNILAHLTHLDDFTPLDTAQVSLSLIVGDKGVRQVLEKPSRPGIYSFYVTPVITGRGKLIIEVKDGSSKSVVTIKDVEVFHEIHEAEIAAEGLHVSDPNGMVFTKEQSWKIDFATEEVVKRNFGSVIRTSAIVQPAMTDKVSIVARTGGIVEFNKNQLFAGTAVEKGQSLFRISGSGLAGDNSYVQFVEAENAYLETKANYERARLLAEDGIVTQSALLKARSDFETARAMYEGLKENFDGGEQVVRSPLNGAITTIHISNGAYVEPGQVLVDVARNERLLLKADVQQKYADQLQNISTANIRRTQDAMTYSLEELNGSLVSYGRSVNPDNYLLPVSFEIDNPGFISGSFVELFIILNDDQKVISVPDDAVLEEQGKYFVLIQLTPELFIRREVETVIGDGLRTVIKGGISEGDRIVSRGAMLVKLSQASGALDPHAGHVH